DGSESPSSGILARARNLTVGYLPQESDPLQSRKTVFETVAAGTPELVEVTTELHRLQARVADPALADDPRAAARVLQEYGNVQTRFEALGGYEVEYRVESVLAGFGFTPEPVEPEVG